jgi:hypothetical protein
VALELELTAPGEWKLKRDNVELGKVRCTGQTALFTLMSPKNALTDSEYEELTKLVRQVMGNLSAEMGAPEEGRRRNAVFRVVIGHQMTGDCSSRH